MQVMQTSGGPDRSRSASGRTLVVIPADRAHETRVLMTFFDGERVAGQETRPPR
jgi:hypothetical protein